MSGITLNSGHALLRGWVTPGYPVVYTAVHRNPDGVPQSWAAPSLHIGAGPQSSIAAATYAGADVALSDLVEGSVIYANARATWTLTAAVTTSWAADPSVWITDGGWLVAGGSISTRSVYRGAEVQCLLDGVVYVTVSPRRYTVDVRDYGTVGDGVADDAPAIQAAIDAAGARGTVTLAPLTYRLGSTLTLGDGTELRGTATKGPVLLTTTDMTAIRAVAGQGQAIRSLKIQSSISGPRTTYDIEIINPVKPVLVDVEVAAPDTSTGAGGIHFRRDPGSAGTVAFMPQLTRVWVRNGHLVIDGVTDGKVTDSYVWAPHTGSIGAIRLVNIADGWNFAGVDVIPPSGDGAGYYIHTTHNTQITGGYIDGSYDTLMTGHGLRTISAGHIYVSSTRFYNLGRSAIWLAGTHGCAFGQIGIQNCSKDDGGHPDIKLEGSTLNTFTGINFARYAARANGGLVYAEDGGSIYNRIANSAVDTSIGITYSLPYMQGAPSTFQAGLRPGPYWPRVAAETIVPPASLLPPPPSAVAWPAANAALFHRFGVAQPGFYRYAKLRCSASAGNIQVAVIALSQSDISVYTRVMSSGVIPCPAGDLVVDMGATYLNAGEYAIALWCDNTSATFWHGLNPAVPAMRMTAKVTSGLAAGIPASGTITWSGDRYVASLSLCNTP